MYSVNRPIRCLHLVDLYQLRKFDSGHNPTSSTRSLVGRTTGSSQTTLLGKDRLFRSFQGLCYLRGTAPPARKLELYSRVFIKGLLERSMQEPDHSMKPGEWACFMVAECPPQSEPPDLDNSGSSAPWIITFPVNNTSRKI